ncbi:hypothetical protein HIM_05836 [Hirsutella minnesotensis 3608]|uniref:Uncharacterized protein n=1 Tax=Hirsutella minnesotensis 3608 TaxID=1043627 RepID=A0A0F8A551_9HYPO|nr:hypothetical protein HIM_05836 [Hirsutella minnesotensis 3608]
MEARSLASVNALAANPPQYPEKPNEDRQDPLVLYISRVPGTRDVILSPFKPQLKNVTAEDVAASLYYVHLEAPSRQSRMLLQLEKPRYSGDDASLRTIPRKPLPDSVRSLTPDSLLGGTRLPPPENLDNQANATLTSYDEASRGPSPMPPTNDSGLTLGPEVHHHLPRSSPSIHRGVPARKPLASQIAAKPPAPAVARPLQPPAPQMPEPNPDNGSGPTDLAGDRFGAEKPGLPPSPPRQSTTSIGAPYTLTLIRRDPSSGNQWNVGRVSSRQQPVSVANDGASSSPDRIAAPAPAYQPIQVEIESSGYAKFRRLFPKRGPDTSPEAVLKAAAETGLPPQIEAGLFSRQVVMGYSRSWTAALKEKLNRLEQAGRARMNQVNHGRNGSFSSVGSDTSPEPSKSEEDSLTKARGYTFASPWDGKCEFRTSMCGRIVQCRHTLHEGEPASWNPLVAEQGFGMVRSGARTVSELRFNLPTSELLGEQAKTTKDQWRGHFDKLLRPGADGSGYDDDIVDDDDAVSPFDVNVGTERAGGGIRGSRAKLGKLVVYHEGLKMLDLVVAANMGVWWQSWERMF